MEAEKEEEMSELSDESEEEEEELDVVEDEAEAEAEEPMEPDDTDNELDFDDLASKAAKTIEPLLLQAKLEHEQLSLDVGISRPRDVLYLVGPDESKAFDTAMVPGQFKLTPEDYSIDQSLDAASAPSEMPREVRGMHQRPLDDAHLRRQEKRAAKEAKLQKWFGLKKQELTPELEQELQVIKMRGVLNPSRFYKGNDSAELPKYFAVATEVGGGMAAAGFQANPGHSGSGKKGKSLLDEVLRDARAQDWVKKRHEEAEQAERAAEHSGHAPHGARGRKRGIKWNEKARTSRQGGSAPVKKKGK